MAWPQANSDWLDILSIAEPAFIELASTISHLQPLIIICQNDDQQAYIRQQLQMAAQLDYPAKFTNIRFCAIPSNDCWARDFGPISVIRDGQPQLLDFQFNGWGERYPSELDNRINYELAANDLFSAPLIAQPFILEGGSVEFDGAGSLLTTRRCLLADNRNLRQRPELQTATQQQRWIEQQLKTWLPIERVLWISNGFLQGDDTDGHIDNLVRFTSADSLVFLSCEDPQDPHYQTLAAMHAELAALRTLDNNAYRLHPLPLPQGQYSRIDGRRLPASYLNFLLLNDAVLVPQFADPADAQALARIQHCFPERTVIGIDSRGFIEQNGGIHCLTMQLAAGTQNCGI